MTCDCSDCAFRGMQMCVHRKLMDENNALRETIAEARRRMAYYFPTKPDGKFTSGQMQNVYDVLERKVDSNDA